MPPQRNKTKQFHALVLYLDESTYTTARDKSTHPLFSSFSFLTLSISLLLNGDVPKLCIKLSFLGEAFTVNFSCVWVRWYGSNFAPCCITTPADRVHAYSKYHNVLSSTHWQFTPLMHPPSFCLLWMKSKCRSLATTELTKRERYRTLRHPSSLALSSIQAAPEGGAVSAHVQTAVAEAGSLLKGCVCVYLRAAWLSKWCLKVICSSWNVD